MSLFHDDVVISQSLFEPISTSLATLVLLGLAVIALYSLRRQWLVGFAIAWYLVGHSMESTLVGLELVFEHRNYIPSIALCLALCRVAGRDPAPSQSRNRF